MVGDLELTTGQVGQINMWQTIGFAISEYIIGMISDKTGKRKPLLIAAILATAVFSALSGLANSYHSLLIIRFLVGVCEGPIYPLAMLMILLHLPRDALDEMQASSMRESLLSLLLLVQFL